MINDLLLKIKLLLKPERNIDVAILLKILPILLKTKILLKMMSNS